jgi:hypothetical protein
MKAAAICLFVALVACTRPAPVPLQRAQSVDQRREITLWREEAAGTLDSNTYLTIAAAGAPFNSNNVFAQIKRGRDVESYWTTNGKPVLSIRDFYGFTASKNRTDAFVIGGLSADLCRRLLPPSASGRVIKLGTYHTAKASLLPTDGLPLANSNVRYWGGCRWAAFPLRSGQAAFRRKEEPERR